MRSLARFGNRDGLLAAPLGFAQLGGADGDPTGPGKRAD
jgi:hypothetical protein